MLRRLLAVAVLGAMVSWAQAPVVPAQAPAPATCQQDGAQCLKTCSSAQQSQALMQCVRQCEAKVDACRAADAGVAPTR
ncbi:MAG: hypothetical protein AB1730_11590 [Myxococcota bacterium]|jgi:hypothetical protein